MLFQEAYPEMYTPQAEKILGNECKCSKCENHIRIFMHKLFKRVNREQKKYD